MIVGTCRAAEVKGGLGRSCHSWLGIACFRSLVFARDMKTITLDETANERSKGWKQGPRESFSSVVKRVVAVPGSLAALLDFVQANRTDAMPGNEVIELSINERSPAKEDPCS